MSRQVKVLHAWQDKVIINSPKVRGYNELRFYANIQERCAQVYFILADVLRWVRALYLLQGICRDSQELRHNERPEPYHLNSRNLHTGNLGLCLPHSRQAGVPALNRKERMK